MRSHSLTSLFAVGTAAALVLGCGKTERSSQPLSSMSPGNAAEQAKAADASTTERAAPDAFGVALPQGATLVSAATVDHVNVFPAQGRLDGGGRIVAGAVGMAGEEHVYSVPLGYDDAVAFYDHSLAGSTQGFEASAPERVMEAASTSWTFEGTNGNPQRVQVRDTTPTTVDVLAVTGSTVAVKAERRGVANMQPGTDVAGSPREMGAGIAHRARRDGGHSLNARTDGGITRTAQWDAGNALSEQWDAGAAPTGATGQWDAGNALSEQWDAGAAPTGRWDAGSSIGARTARADDWM